MKKSLLAIVIILTIMGFYFISIYSFALNADRVGGIELRKGGGNRVELSQEEVSYLVNEINTLNFKIFNQATENDIDEIENKGPTAKFRLFVFDKNGNELADIRIFDELNISYVKEFDGSLSLGYHATNGTFDLVKLNILAE